jgi:predicted Zn-dependent protease
VKAPVASSKLVGIVLGCAVGFLIHPFSVAENLNHSQTEALFSAAPESGLVEEIAALPVPAPILFAPLVKAPVMPGHISKEMQKLALKYDVSKIGERGVGKGMNFYSIDREMEMGKELSDEVEMSARMMLDPEINEYVNRLGQNLARNSDAKTVFTIRVIQSPEVNAFALPGGYFYVNTGLVLAADSEAELAGVMAHEIAHVAARHATHNLSKRNLIALCTLPAVFVAGPVGMAVTEASDMARPLTFLKFSRDAEREADLLGMEYAYATGYDPAAMVSFFERMQAQEKKKKGYLARAFDTHPMKAERVKRAQAVMSAMLPAKDEYRVTTNEFNDVKARLAALVDQHGVDAPGSLPTLQ